MPVTFTAIETKMAATPNYLRRLEIRTVTPAVGRFAPLANTFARPTAFEGILAFKAFARLDFVNALRFWFHCWFGHEHTVAYGDRFVKKLVKIIAILLQVFRSARLPRPDMKIFQKIPIKHIIVCFTLSIFLNTSPSNAADMAKGLAAAKKGDFTTALEEWLPLARDGDASAQYNVGQLYRLGRGVPRDYEKAVQWYAKAAEQRHSAARHNLAVIYEKGLGVPIDYAKAVQWYEKAASQDFGIAQFNLAVMYSLGQGTKRDLVKAYTWYDIAADRGVDGAAENRDLVGKRMSEAQLRRAKEKAREWIDWRK